MKLSVPKRVQLSAFLFVVAGILAFICCELKQEHVADFYNVNSQISFIEVHNADLFQQKMASVNVEERPMVTSEFAGTVQAKNAAIRFEKDLETSISKQDLPTMRLIFSTTSGEVQSADLVLAARDALSKTWKTTLQLCQKNTSVMDYESRLDIQQSYINSNAIAIQRLENLTITTPFGIRKISEYEASEIIKTLNKLAIRRFQELSSMNGSLYETNLQNPFSTDADHTSSKLPLHKTSLERGRESVGEVHQRLGQLC